MTGNSQNGGICLNITRIPTMPYYPQTITISYYHPTLRRTLTRKVHIRDCDGDDITCEEYYGLNNLQIAPSDMEALSSDFVADEYTANSEDQSTIVDQDLHCVIYDLSGRILPFRSEVDLIHNYHGPSQIVVVSYWDHNRIVKTRKLFVRER